jgi:hypothetical protein
MVPRAHRQNIQSLQTQPKQQAHSLTIMQQPATLALSPQQLQMIQPPLNIDVNPLLKQAVLAMQREYTPDSSNVIYDNKTKEFDLADYNEITQKYQTWMTGNSNAKPPEPDNPVQNSTMDQYTAVFCKVHKQQSAQHVTSSVWVQIWTLPIESLHKLVKQRRNCIQKATYAENLKAEFAPYAAVDKFDKLEYELWNRGRGSQRSAGTWL